MIHARPEADNDARLEVDARVVIGDTTLLG